MLKSTPAYSRFLTVPSPSSGDEPANNSASLNDDDSIDGGESSQHSQATNSTTATSTTTPLSSLTNKYDYAANYGMYGTYHNSMSTAQHSGQYASSIAGAIADSCAAHWSTGRMNPGFYSNAAAMTSASMSSATATNMLGHRLHYNSHRNSTGGSSSSAESSSTSLISDENSPTSSSTTYHHTNQLRVPYHPTAATNNISSPSTTSSSSNIPYPPYTTDSTALFNRAAATATGSGSLPLKKRRPVPVEHKDMTYWEKRRKNNESAKKSRDQKREKEGHMLVRISYLENENIQLKARLHYLEEENKSLKALLHPNSN